VFLELVDRHLPVVNGNEVDELSVVLDVDITLLDFGLEVENVFFFAGLGLPETGQGCLTQGKVFQLGLGIATLALRLDLSLHNFFTSFHRVNHSLNV